MITEWIHEFIGSLVIFAFISLESEGRRVINFRNFTPRIHQMIRVVKSESKTI